jgi:outer membrane receptor protein involved in Fe transport
MISRSKFPMRASGFVFVLALALFVLFLGGAVMAQEVSGTIKGTVVDQQGAVVPGASVTARSTETGTERTVTSDSEGSFAIAKLPLGKYTLTVEKAGFKKKAVTDVGVKLGDLSMGNVSLEAGAVSETVTVTSGTEEIVNRDQSQISASFESRKIAELPSNSAGGGIDTLALLIPGVAQNSGGGTNTNGTGLSVNGNRGRSNNFQIDGSDNNDLSVGGPNLFVDNQDQVQEYQVVTNNFSAQYGRNLGAVVNIVTKSGTNDFHGSLFEFHRDQFKLDSLNNVERASGQLNPDRFLTNVFGGTVGGPIILPRFGEGGKSYWKGTNKAFFFASYEGIRQPQTITARSGGFGIIQNDLPKLTAAFPGNTLIGAIVGLNPTVLPLGTLQARTDLRSCNATTEKLAGRPFADCNRDFIDVGAGVAGVVPVRVEGFLLERLFPFDYTQNEWSVRGDMRVTDKDNFYVRFLSQTGVQKNDLGSTNGFTGDLIFTTRNFGGTYNRQINSRMVNEARLVRTNLFVDFGGGCDPATPGCIPSPSLIDDAQAENINPSGVRGVSLTGNALRSMGIGGGLPQGRSTILYDLADNLTWTRGKHSLILGGEFKYTNAKVPFLPNYGGSYTFNTQTRVINNAPSAVSIALGNPNVAYTEDDQYYFIQDDFKLRPNLTLNLGLRYEYTGQPIDDLSDFTAIREASSTPFFNPALPLSARIVPRVAPDKNNFAPRFGFAWSPHAEHGFMHTLLGTDATVIRGGYAIAYDPAFYNILLNVANSSPFSISLAATATQLPAAAPLLPLPGIFGAQVRAFAQASGVLPIGKLDPKYLNQTQVAPDFRSPYSQQWSFGFQRQIGRNFVAEARYVGNHGVGLFQSVLRNPFVGVSGNYVAQAGVPASAVGKPIATTHCTVGGSASLPTCLGGLYGFTRNINVNGTTTAVSFPSFASQVIPSTFVGLSCVDVAGTPDNEGACNGRVRVNGAITDRENTAQSSYHSLQTRVNGRLLKNSLNIGGTYTFSKTIDDSSEVFGFNGEGSILPQNPFDYHSERSVSALHRPHIFSMNFIYDVPFKKEQRGFVGHLLGGWQLNGTHVYNSGRRYTASQSFNAGFLGLGASYLSGGESLRPFAGNPAADQQRVAMSQVDAFMIGFVGSIQNVNGFYLLNDLNNGIITPVTPNDVRFIFNGPGSARIFGTPYGNVPRYSLHGPALNQTNIGIFKNTKVWEKVTIQVRAELFNAFNHPNIGYGVTRNSSLPSTFIENAGIVGGEFANNNRIPLARRVVQFGLRLVF